MNVTGAMAALTVTDWLAPAVIEMVGGVGGKIVIVAVAERDLPIEISNGQSQERSTRRCAGIT